MPEMLWVAARKTPPVLRSAGLGFAWRRMRVGARRQSVQRTMLFLTDNRKAFAHRLSFRCRQYRISAIRQITGPLTRGTFGFGTELRGFALAVSQEGRHLIALRTHYARRSHAERSTCP
jgi:hypothetical protein